MFFRSCFCKFFTIYSKRYSKNIRDSLKNRDPANIIIYYLIIVERASTARASPEISTCEVPNDVGLMLPADSVYENGVVEVSLLYV